MKARQVSLIALAVAVLCIANWAEVQCHDHDEENGQSSEEFEPFRIIVKDLIERIAFGQPATVILTDTHERELSDSVLDRLRVISDFFRNNQVEETFSNGIKINYELNIDPAHSAGDIEIKVVKIDGPREAVMRYKVTVYRPPSNETGANS